MVTESTFPHAAGGGSYEYYAGLPGEMAEPAAAVLSLPTSHEVTRASSFLKRNQAPALHLSLKDTHAAARQHHASSRSGPD